MQIFAMASCVNAPKIADDDACGNWCSLLVDDAAFRSFVYSVRYPLRWSD